MSKYLPFQLFLRQALLYPLTSPFLPPVDKVELGYSYAAGEKVGTLVGGGNFGLPKTSQTVVYKTNDDGTYQKGKPDAPPRFVDNGNGTITDNATGLMWVKDPSQLGGVWGTPGTPAVMTWPDAIDNCEALDYAGHDDWRLPNINELASIVDCSRYNPHINPTFFPNTDKVNVYFSSTTAIFNTAAVFYVSFGVFNIYIADKIAYSVARPVRG